MYSILIFENFNRPRIIRWFERIWIRFSKEDLTLGIMQTKSSTPISDTESVKKGTQNLFEKYLEYKSEEYTCSLFRRVIKRHNPDKKYVRQVLFISKAIIDNQLKKEDYSGIFSEIKSEFNLYDYYD